MALFTFVLCLFWSCLSICPHHTYTLSHKPLSFYQTAVMEHCSRHHVPAAIAFAFKRCPTPPLVSNHAIAIVLLSLAGTVETNPGPDFSLCSLNIRSLNQDNSIFLTEIIMDHSFDIIALQETRLSSRHTSAELIELTPPGYDLISSPRLSGEGGGVAFLVRQSLTYTLNHIESSTFEAIAITIRLPSTSLSILNIYRPPDSSRYSYSFNEFISEFHSILTTYATTPHHFLIVGDFNIHVDDPTDSHARTFMSLLSDTNLTQHVHFPTHTHKHTLDLIIGPSDSLCLPHVDCLNISPSDHKPILTKLNLQTPRTINSPPQSFRRLAAIDILKFSSDIAHSDLLQNPPSSLEELVQCYNSTLSQLLDKHAPLITKNSCRPHNLWYTPALRALKNITRKAERLWLKSRNNDNWTSFRHSLSKYHSAIKTAKQEYYSNQVTSNIGNPKSLWTTVNNILHRRQSSPLPTSSPTEISLPTAFANFFNDKISKLRLNIQSALDRSVSPHHPEPLSHPATFSQFRQVTQEEVLKVLLSCPNKYCELDPIPTWLLKKCSEFLIPTITKIINLSFTTGIFPDQLKHSVIKPLLKKPSMDKESLSNYRPVSNLSFISKLAERLAKNQLTEHLSSHSLFNSHQSAYTKAHSTETVLLSLHDHLVQAMSHQNITGLCLLDLSAAFDTIDHTILLKRLTDWFGLSNSVLSWISSYLSSRTFTVSVRNQTSSIQPVSYGVPQGSVLGPLLFIMYTTPLSHLIRSTSVDHHLYADDTQLYISFKPAKFQNAISQLQSLFTAVSSWMSSNLLALNPSKTEFLLIGTPQQVQTLTDSSISLTHDTTVTPASAVRNLGFIFDTHLSYHNQISSLTKACFYHIRDLRRIRPCLDHATATTIATSLVHSKLDYCNSLYLNLPKNELNRIQQIQNTLARVVSKSSRHDHITPTLQSLHWLKIQERITFKVASITYSLLHTSEPDYLSRLITLQPTRSTRSSKLITLYPPAITSNRAILNRSFSYSAPKIWNSLPPELRQHKANGLPGQNELSKSTFLSKLKTHLFKLSYSTLSPATPWPPD